MVSFRETPSHAVLHRSAHSDKIPIISRYLLEIKGSHQVRSYQIQATLDRAKALINKS